MPLVGRGLAVDLVRRDLDRFPARISQQGPGLNGPIIVRGKRHSSSVAGGKSLWRLIILFQEVACPIGRFRRGQKAPRRRESGVSIQRKLPEVRERWERW